MILKRAHDVNPSVGELGTMHRARRIPIVDINPHITCILCKGYFIDATTIIECLHTFCKSCIVRYLETHKYCPVCDVQVHKTKPLLNIRPDKTLQDVVYKLVPKLFQNEMQRRRDYYSAHPDCKPTSLEQKGEASYQHLLSPDETICLSLNYHGSSGTTTRYLRCPAAVSVAHLQKLIRAKYGLTNIHRIDVLYNQDCLNSYLTLMDIAYIYLWRRKGPLELTYRIYENTAKKLKVDKEATEQKDSTTNINDWKEVQLRISENGEMSVTGIQDTIEIINNHKLLEKEEIKSNVLPLVDSLLEGRLNENLNEVKMKDEEAKNKKFNNSQSNNVSANNTVNNSTIKLQDVKETVTSAALDSNANSTSTVQCRTLTTVCSASSIASSSVVTAATATIVAARAVSEELSKGDTVSESISNEANKIISHPVITSTSSCGTKLTLKYNNSIGEKAAKHKIEPMKSEFESPMKQAKPSVSNHSLGLQNLSNNHPLKKHSQLNRIAESSGLSEAKIKPLTVTTTSAPVTNTTQKLTTVINKNFNNIQLNRPGTPIVPQKWAKNPLAGPTCYMPKPNYSPVINVPKIQPSTSTPKPTDQQISALPHKATIKTKPSTPIGYKTLRDPPKTWNPQITRPNPNKLAAETKSSDPKNIRPAKFFKMRNNMPRYLGNPASGVKPMYQLHVSLEKEKPENKSDKTEIKKHSIVKIDPKTLKPISERAPETSNLSNQTDLKINTSSVPIFNPLKLQSSPKSERKSPHSPKKSSSPPNKREKLNLSFTPTNPFVPNLASPTVNPNQFLYTSGPPGFPPYDPRVMAAYHSLFYGQRMPFPPPLTGLTLDLNQRKKFEIPPPTSPKQPTAIKPCTQTSNNHPHPISSPKSASTPTTTTTKKHKESTKPEKSLQNAVEKLTQNRIKNEKPETKQPPHPQSSAATTTTAGTTTASQPSTATPPPAPKDNKEPAVKTNANCCDKKTDEVTRKVEVGAEKSVKTDGAIREKNKNSDKVVESNQISDTKEIEKINNNNTDVVSASDAVNKK